MIGTKAIEAAQLFAHLEAVHVGQHQVEEDRVGLLLPRERDAVFALGRRDDAKALELERVGEPEHDVRLVLDDENRLLGGHHTCSGRSATRSYLGKGKAGRRFPSSGLVLFKGGR